MTDKTEGEDKREPGNQRSAAWETKNALRGEEYIQELMQVERGDLARYEEFIRDATEAAHAAEDALQLAREGWIRAKEARVYAEAAEAKEEEQQKARDEDPDDGPDEDQDELRQEARGARLRQQEARTRADEMEDLAQEAEKRAQAAAERSESARDIWQESRRATSGIREITRRSLQKARTMKDGETEQEGGN